MQEAQTDKIAARQQQRQRFLVKLKKEIEDEKAAWGGTNILGEDIVIFW